MAQSSSESERLLYRVLHRANLVQYYDTFVAQGGDDVAQLCEAGEEEFLEIMALVGMAAKPLHVRRLQKALQEWVSNPALFMQPIGTTTPPPPMARGSIVSVLGRPVANSNQYHSTPARPEHKTIVIAPTSSSSVSTWNINPEGLDSQSCSPIPTTIENEVAFIDAAPIWKAPNLFNGSDLSPNSGMDFTPTSVSPTPSGGGQVAIPQLNESQISALETSAEALVGDLPVYDMKPLNMKRDYNRELMQLITMPDDHPDKMTLLRKYAAIYNRFDSKRKNEGKMTLHEVSVNEAAAQLCRRIPALLTRRDDLYPLSRRVVRDSGYQYSKGHSRACSSIDILINNKRALAAAAGGSPSKQLKFEEPSKHHEVKEADFDLESGPRERVNEIYKELSEIVNNQEEVKSKIQEAREKGDLVSLGSLRSELEQCATKQLQLRMEQSAIIGSSASKSKAKPASASVGRSVEPDAVNGTPKNMKTDSPNANQQNNKTSLVEEGLRIAQQYGMADFAQELMKGMTNDSGSELDEQEEWNREVEKDMLLQNQQNTG